MPTSPRQPTRPTAVLARDAALARAARVRGLVVAGSAALSAGFAGLAAAGTPTSARAGARAGARTAGSTPDGALRAPALPPLASPSALGLPRPADATPPAAPASAPDQPAAPAPAAAPPGGVVSGGS